MILGLDFHFFFFKKRFLFLFFFNIENNSNKNIPHLDIPEQFDAWNDESLTRIFILNYYCFFFKKKKKFLTIHLNYLQYRLENVSLAKKWTNWNEKTFKTRQQPARNHHTPLKITSIAPNHTRNTTHTLPRNSRRRQAVQNTRKVLIQARLCTRRTARLNKFKQCCAI